MNRLSPVASDAARSCSSCHSAASAPTGSLEVAEGRTTRRPCPPRFERGTFGSGARDNVSKPDDRGRSRGNGHAGVLSLGGLLRAAMAVVDRKYGLAEVRPLEIPRELAVVAARRVGCRGGAERAVRSSDLGAGPEMDDLLGRSHAEGRIFRCFPGCSSGPRCAPWCHTRRRPVVESAANGRGRTMEKERKRAGSPLTQVT